MSEANTLAVVSLPVTLEYTFGNEDSVEAWMHVWLAVVQYTITPIIIISLQMQRVSPKVHIKFSFCPSNPHYINKSWKKRGLRLLVNTYFPKKQFVYDTNICYHVTEVLNYVHNNRFISFRSLSTGFVHFQWNIRALQRMYFVCFVHISHTLLTNAHPWLPRWHFSGAMKSAVII